MRKTNIEIEFKTEIDKLKYEELLSKLDLEDNIFKQTNYYFDTKDLALNGKHIVLRIRQKGDRYKLTLKSQAGNSAFENHVFINKEQALELIDKGIETKKYFDDLDHKVEFKASLDNYRVSTPYLEGTLFLDKCVYHGITDYEVEYEYHDYDEGKKIFEKFLEANGIKDVQTKRKSEKALLNKKA